MGSSTKDTLAILVDIRSKRERKPEQVVELGRELERARWFEGNTDQVYVVVEQVAVAAIECGQLSFAERLVDKLAKRFPDSPRVDVLLGQLMEGKGAYEQAKEYYQVLLQREQTNVPIRKRLISLHLNHGAAANSKGKAPETSSLSREKGLIMLVEYAETFYNDDQAWSELAGVYSSLRLYQQALTALAHLILIAPHNPFHLLKHAETAYTIGDYPLAYKEFLRVIEMSDGVSSTGGAGRRAAMGLKLVINKLNASRTASQEAPLEPKKIKEIDLLVTKLILDSYAASGAHCASTTRKWLEST